MLKRRKKASAMLMSLVMFGGAILPFGTRVYAADEDAAVSVPSFSLESGFYSGEQSLTITAPQGTTVYYTTDGSTPDAGSEVYSGAITLRDNSSSPNVLSARTDIVPPAASMWGGGGIWGGGMWGPGGGGMWGPGGGEGNNQETPGTTAPSSPVDKANVIRAVAVDSEGNVSEPVTGTYFIDYNNKKSYYNSTKIISIVTDSDNLFDYEKGIYVMGKTYDDWKKSSEYDPSTRTWLIPANYTQKGKEWERPAVMQIFEDGELALSQNVGIRIHGGATRAESQKSLNVYARKEYGAGSVKYDLFSGNVKNDSGEPIVKFDSFILRNGGNDNSGTRWRDKLNQGLVSDRDFLVQGMEPAIVFIDGEYWGHYEITEKLSEDFVSDHYGVKKKNVCIIKNEELDEGDEAGLTEFEQLYEWIKSTDLSNDANYAQLAQKIDMESFIDYMSSEFYIGNADWGENNMAMWKSLVTDDSNAYADGKWRFIMYDTEYSTGLYGQNGANDDPFRKLMSGNNEGKQCFLSTLFSAVIKNEQFRKQFATVFMDIANNNFDKDKVSSRIDELFKEYQDYTQDTCKRFSANSNYSNEKNTISQFYNSRFNSVTDTMKRTLGLSGNRCELTINNDDSKGTVTVNTITPDMKNGSWKGQYYSDYPVTLTAQPAYGSRLAYWETSTGEKLNGDTVELKLTDRMTVTAVYEDSDVIMGDVNSDGTFSSADAVLFQKWLLAVPNVEIAEKRAADMNNDNKLNVFDFCVMKKKLKAGN